jgi:hypothetical protein
MGLGQNPAQATELMELSGWTENRLVYSVTKINLGILALFAPENPRLAEAPDFSRPTPGEMATLEGHRDDFFRALTRFFARPGAK